MICQVGSIGSGQSSSKKIICNTQSESSYASLVPHGILAVLTCLEKTSNPILGGVVAFIWIVLILLQPSKADPPMLLTLSGIVIEVREVQPSKARYPILVTLLGIVIGERELQP